MKAVIKRVNEKLETIDLEKELGRNFEKNAENQGIVDLDATYELIGCSMVETCYYMQELVENRIDMIVDEEGKLSHKEFNVVVADKKGKIIDIIVGNILFVGVDEDGNWVELTDEQIKVIDSIFRKMNLCFLEDEYDNTIAYKVYFMK